MSNRFFNQKRDVFCLFCISVAQLVKACLIALFPEKLLYYYFAQFLGSFGQGGLSDIQRRKVHLSSSLFMLFLFSGVLFFNITHLKVYWVDLVSMLAIALSGNSDVMGRVTLIDVHPHKDKRLIMCDTIIAESSVWVIGGLLIWFSRITAANLLFVSMIFSFLLFVYSLFVEDKTRGTGKFKNLFLTHKNLSSNGGDRRLSKLALVSLLAELGFMLFFYSQEKSPSIVRGHSFQGEVMVAWAAPLVLASYLQSKITHLKEKFLLKIGLCVSIAGSTLFIFYLAFFPFVLVKLLSYCVMGFGSGCYLPCLYSLISKGQNVHHQGLLTGWLDSIRTGSDLLGNAFLGIAYYFQVGLGSGLLFPLFSIMVYILTIYLSCRKGFQIIFSFNVLKKGKI